MFLLKNNYKKTILHYVYFTQLTGVKQKPIQDPARNKELHFNPQEKQEVMTPFTRVVATRRRARWFCWHTPSPHRQAVAAHTALGQMFTYKRDQVLLLELLPQGQMRG